LTGGQVTESLRADLAAYSVWSAAQLAQAGSLTSLGAQTAGAAFTFNSLGITISAVEGLTVLVDGVEVALQTLIHRPPTDVVLSNTTIDEGAEPGTVIATLSGSDPDAGQSATLSFSLAEPSDAFEIIGNELVVKEDAVLDFEANPVRSVSVTATDVTGLTRTQIFNITVNNVDEPATGGVSISSYAAGSTAAQLTATHTISEPDGMTTEPVFQWQVSTDGGNSWTDIAGATNATNTPGGVAAGSLVRVTAIYSDAFDQKTMVSPENFSVGTSGANTLAVMVPAQVILGLAGNDTITGFSNGQKVDGGAGTDTIRISGTSAHLNAASDAQIINVEAISASGAQGSVVLDLSRQSERLTISGSSFADVITGTANADVISAGSGDDRIMGFVGADRINGGGGRDTLVLTDTSTDLNSAINSQLGSVEVISAQSAAAGVTISLVNQTERFTIIGSAFADVITGGQGSDVFTGLTEGDTVNGAGGRDTLQLTGSLAVLNAAADAQIVNIEVLTFSGFTGGLTIDLSRQSDGFTFTATSLADVITGSSGADIVNTGSGDDHIIGFVGADRINGGSGRDTLDVFETSADLNSATNEQLVSVEVVTAEDAGSGVEVSLASQTEGFTITGSAFADMITGGQGNDVFTDFTEGDVVNGFSGTDTLRLIGSIAALNSASDDQIANVEAVTLSGLTEGVELDLSRQSDGFAITSTGLADVITGSSGDDVIATGSGDDRIIGFVGADIINGGSGRDTLGLIETSADLNNAGNDQLVSIEVVTADSAASGVTIDFVNQTEGFTIVGSDFSDNLRGGAGRDTISAGDGDDIVVGFTAGDVVDGGAGRDTLAVLQTSTGLNTASNTQFVNVEVVSAADAAASVTIDLSRQSEGLELVGSGWADVLIGSLGKDVISGGAGNDTIRGGAGADALFGGDDADVFVFAKLTDLGTPAATRDVIMDFVGTQQSPDQHDIIDLSAIDAIQGGSDQAFNFNPVAWDGAGQQFTGAGQLRYQFVTDEDGAAKTIVSGNVNSNLAADFQVALLGHISLTAADFIL
jgi:Ca2+-binding RTX toxin-like protein